MRIKTEKRKKRKEYKELIKNVSKEKEKRK